jgi:hypothetical protein
MRTRKHRIEFVLDDKEFGILDRAVSRSGLNFSQYLRHLIEDKVPRDKPASDYYDFLQEVRTIAAGIKQIAWVATETGGVDTDLLEENYRQLLEVMLRVIDSVEMPRKAG